LKQSNAQKIELEHKIKEMEIKLKEQGKVLEKLANEEEFQAKFRGYVDELRVWKDKCRKLQDLQEKDDRSKANQHEMNIQITEENDDLKQQIQ